MADLSSDIAQQAVEPASSAADGQSSSARPVGDLIKAQQFLDAKAVMKKRRRGLLMTRIVTPGPLDDYGRSGGSFDSPGSY